MDTAPVPPVVAGRHPPLLVTRDEALLDDLLRLCAAAGTTPEVAHDVSAAMRAWPLAAAVVVGADLAGAVAELSPGRRTGVHVVCRGHAPDELFRSALRAGAESLAELPASDAWLVETLTDAVDGTGPPGVTVGVLGGSGGVGASVFAASLAVELARAGPVLLVDADPLGAGLDRILGLETRHGVRWDALHQATGRLSARALREAVPTRGELGVLTWGSERRIPLQAFAVREVLSAGARGFGTVVVDLPRYSDAVRDEVLARCDHVVLLSGLTVPAVAAAGRVAAGLAQGPADVLLVTRGSAGVAAQEVASVLRLPLVTQLRDQRGLDEALHLGAGPVRSRRGALARAAREVASALGHRAARAA